VAGRIKVELDDRRKRGARVSQRVPPMRILLMGDFGGSDCPGETGRIPLGDRSPMWLEAGGIDRAVRTLRPCVSLAIKEAQERVSTIEFGSLDDFHPDSLYARVGIFGRLRDLRARLLCQETFAAAADEVRAEVGASASGTPNRVLGDTGSDVRESDTETIFRLLGQTTSLPPASRHTGAGAELIRRIVEPHVTPGTPHRDAYVAVVDGLTTARMRALLHHPGFQALESAWRGADWLLSGLDVGESWELWVLDLTQAELEQDLRSGGTQVTRSQVYKLLVEPSNGLTDGNPWSLLVGNYSFGPSIEHVDVLATMGALGSVAGAPFLAAADPLVAGCPSLAEAPEPSDWVAPDPKSAERWGMLRRSPAAAWLGLALPRLLLRLPYGKETDPCESFGFEELSAAREHNHYLWGNPALGCATLIARWFLDHSWAEGQADSLVLNDLPAHAYREGGETKLQAVAEAYLSERAWQQILGVGVMPFLSYRNRNAARLAMFQSLAEPRAALPFVWGAKPSAVSD